MRFGDLLRAKRKARGWTQPQASERIDIEQSYLSKLESGKSVPSSEVFQRLAATYQLDLGALPTTLFPAELDRLRDVEAVRDLVRLRQERSRAARHRWLVGGLVNLTLGGAMVGLSQLSAGGTTHRFVYQSQGVVHADEPRSVFDALDGPPPEGAAARAAWGALLERREERTRWVERYRGPEFVESVADGKRVWRLFGGEERPRLSPYRLALVPGIGLIFAGLGCFFISWRWR